MAMGAKAANDKNDYVLAIPKTMLPAVVKMAVFGG